MPILIYHGNGLIAMSRAVSAIKAKFEQVAISEFNGKTQTIEQVLMGVATQDLFSPSRLILLENFTDKTDITKLTADSSTTVVLRHSKPLAASSVLLKSAKEIKAQIQEFSEAEEVSIFPFLDLLGEKKPAAFAQFEKVYAEYGGQYIFTMLYYFFRRMIVTPKKTPSFAMQKLERQKSNFPLEKIQTLYQMTLETDFKIKSGLIEERLGLTLVVQQILEP